MGVFRKLCQQKSISFKNMIRKTLFLRYEKNKDQKSNVFYGRD